MTRVEHIGDCALYLGDCLEIMPTLGKVDAVVTDPPYGIGIASNPIRQKHEKMNWDTSPPKQDVIDLILSLSDKHIIWGGNYFNLPPTQRFLIWDKKQPENFSLAMCEMAWTSIGGPAKTWRQSVLGYEKTHPTQKPVDLMKWCLGFITDAKTILDPFMGSGTTGVACANMDRKFIGVELEQKYFDIACKRIEDAYKQPRLFVEQPKKSVQDAISFNAES